jgi:hypothetical protein
MTVDVLVALGACVLVAVGVAVLAGVMVAVAVAVAVLVCVGVAIGVFVAVAAGAATTPRTLAAWLVASPLEGHAVTVAARTASSAAITIRRSKRCRIYLLLSVRLLRGAVLLKRPELDERQAQ